MKLITITRPYSLDMKTLLDLERKLRNASNSKEVKEHTNTIINFLNKK